MLGGSSAGGEACGRLGESGRESVGQGVQLVTECVVGARWGGGEGARNMGEVTRTGGGRSGDQVIRGKKPGRHLVVRRWSDVVDMRVDVAVLGWEGS